MSALRLSSSTRLAGWLYLMWLVQVAGGFVLLLILLCAPFLGRAILERGGRLVWRARWLLLSILGVFAWGDAGEPVWNVIWAPTYEGIREGALQVGHLASVLMVVAAFLETMKLPELLSATHALLTPLRFFGVDCDRGVVRLMLVLRYAENLPRPRDWRSLLDAPEVTTTESVEVVHQPWERLDRLILLCLAASVLVYCLIG